MTVLGLALLLAAVLAPFSLLGSGVILSLAIVVILYLSTGREG